MRSFEIMQLAIGPWLLAAPGRSGDPLVIYTTHSVYLSGNGCQEKNQHPPQRHRGTEKASSHPLLAQRMGHPATIFVMLLRVYIDDSSDEKKQEAVVAGAFVGWYHQWNK